jgi:putative sterol carrier protein
VARVYMNSRLFQQLVQGQTTPSQAMASGQLNAEMGSFTNERLSAVLEAITTSSLPT